MKQDSKVSESMLLAVMLQHLTDQLRNKNKCWVYYSDHTLKYMDIRKEEKIPALPHFGRALKRKVQGAAAAAASCQGREIETRLQ